MTVYDNRDGVVVSEAITSGSTVTTYIGVAIAQYPNTDSLAQLKAKPIRQINKYIKTTSGGIESNDEFQPCKETTTGNGVFVRTTEPIFIWDDRATLTYK